MVPLDVNEIANTAKREMAEERTKEATKALKELYAKKEKAELIVRNIQREIDNYLKEVSELSVYASAGVDVSK